MDNTKKEEIVGSKPNRREFFAGIAKAAAIAGLVGGWPVAPVLSSELARADDAYFVATHLGTESSPITEPYQPLHGGDFSGPTVALSPDPLVRYRWRHTDSNDILQYYLLRPVSASTSTPQAFHGLKSASRELCDITVRGTGNIRLDFGTESAAWMEIDSPDLAGRVEMGVSEYDAPAHEKCIAVPERIGNTCRLKLNPLFYEGVRFGWIYVRSYSGQPWHISAIRLVCQIKPTNYDGSFSCSNDMLTRIWYTGAYTVKLNLEPKYFGAILMNRGDRISWTGDAHIAQAASMVAFGNWGFIKKNLDFTANDSNGIGSYALYWVLSLVDYYRYTGDKAALRQYISNVQAKLSQAQAMFENPVTVFYGWDDRLAGGFLKYGNHESRQAYRLLYIETCRQFAWALGAADEDTLRDQYLEMAREHATKIQAEPDWAEKVGIFVASDGINSGVPTPSQDQLFHQRNFTNPVERISFSPFNQYFIIQAMGRMNWTDEALQTVLEDWGGQIEYGGTSFFECYWPSWNAILPKNGPIPDCTAGITSLCHPWSAGCTTWLTEYVAGITPTAPGFATVDITPHLGRLLTHVAADAPTPHGTIHASFDVDRGVAEVTTPPGIVARIGIPKVERQIRTIHVNGHLVWNGSSHPMAGISSVSEASECIYFNGVYPGRYTFSIAYSGHTPAYVARPLVYPVRAGAQDSKTQGNWGGTYGRDGYVLFAYEDGGDPKESLPSYVESVTCQDNRYVQWPGDSGDPRALAPVSSNQGRRIASGVFAGITFVVDIRLAHPYPYRLAVYVVDFDRKERWESVDLYTFPSLVLSAPVQGISDFEGGKYLVFDCQDSVRLRFNTIRGPDAVVSGVFFDPAKTD
jgi:alpha-L-rhamnosidase